MTHALNLASEIAAADQQGAVAQMLYQALLKPFAVYNDEEGRLMTLLHVAMDIDHGRMGENTLRAVQQAEPAVPWQLNFLKIRSACYASFQFPLAAQAKRDLAEYVAADSTAAESKDAPEIAPANRLAAIDPQ